MGRATNLLVPVMVFVAVTLGCMGKDSGESDVQTDADTDTDSDTETGFVPGDPVLTMAVDGTTWGADDGYWTFMSDYGSKVIGEHFPGGMYNKESLDIVAPTDIGDRGDHALESLRYVGLANSSYTFQYEVTSGTLHVVKVRDDYLYAEITEPLTLHGFGVTPSTDQVTITELTIDAWPHW